MQRDIRKLKILLQLVQYFFSFHIILAFQVQVFFSSSILLMKVIHILFREFQQFFFITTFGNSNCYAFFGIFNLKRNNQSQLTGC